MKLTETTRFYTGTNTEQTTGNAVPHSGKTRLYAGGSMPQNPLDAQIAQKRTAAMDKAKKLLGDVFAAEKSIDDDLAERANRISESKRRIVDANKELAALREEKEKLKEQYGLAGDETEEMLPEEYKMQRDELTRYGDPYRQTIAEATDIIEEEQKIIAAVKVERLKSAPMVGASKEAEEVLASAEEEIVGLVMDEAVETMEEHMEEAKEKQELEEEKAELEEARRKEREERRKEAELPDVPMQELLQLEQTRDGMKQEVDQMLTKMKLLVEDIKGSMVDEKL